MIRLQYVASAARLPLGIALVLSLTMSAGWATAAVIVDSQGFEAPLFDTTFGPGGPGTGSGQLEGQTPATFNGTWLRTKGPGLSTADVQATVVDSGLQAVEVNRVANSDDRWGVPVSGYPASGCICIDWRMRVEDAGGDENDLELGPFFGVEAYDDDAARIGLIGTLGVDATTGDVVYQTADDGFIANTGKVISFGAWNSYQMKLDFTTKTYALYLNGEQLDVTGDTVPDMIGFVDENNVPGGLNEFTDANISTFAIFDNPASLAMTGTAYFDRFVVIDGTCPVIPEPGTMLLTVVGLMLLPYVSRRSQR